MVSLTRYAVKIARYSHVFFILKSINVIVWIVFSMFV